MKQWQTPDTRAFRDAFTREFLDKDVETPEGFHLFRSGTGYYTILFPENYVLDKGVYYRKKGVGSEHPDTENVYLHQYGISPKKDRLIKEVELFLKPDGNVLPDISIEIMLEKIKAASDTKVKSFKDGNKTVYYAENVDDYNAKDGHTNTNFYFYGFITHNQSKQALYFELENTCFHSNERCPIDYEKEKEMALKMMKSVEFQ